MGEGVLLDQRSDNSGKVIEFWKFCSGRSIVEVVSSHHLNPDFGGYIRSLESQILGLKSRLDFVTVEQRQLHSSDSLVPMKAFECDQVL